MRKCCLLVSAVLLWSVLPLATVHAEHDGKLQILLLGDSTTEGSVPRRHVPEGPHLEDVIRELLAEEPDLPPTNVINLGLSGEYIRRLLDSGRYESAASKLPGIDFVLIRYGLNDLGKDPGESATVCEAVRRCRSKADG